MLASDTSDAQAAVGPFYAAIGIPEGVIVDRATGEMEGAVRRGGELVSLDQVEYGLWLLLLTPMTRALAVEAALHSELDRPDPAVARLEELNLLVKINPGDMMDDDLSRLRPIPLGVGLGNLKGDHTRFEIQNTTLSLPSPVSVDAVAIMIWWGFDGARSLREAVSHASSWLPELSVDRAGATATRLVNDLMTARLLYLDA